jgi:hypothetical protein
MLDRCRLAGNIQQAKLQLQQSEKYMHKEHHAYRGQQGRKMTEVRQCMGAIAAASDADSPCFAAEKDCGIAQKPAACLP